MKKSMMTIGLLMGGLTATAAWAIESTATAPVSGHAPTVSVPDITTTDIKWLPSPIRVEFVAPSSDDTDEDEITKVTYWLEDAAGNKYAKKDQVNISEITDGSLEFSNFNELKNKKLNLVWQVHTQYGYPASTLVSDIQKSNDFQVAAAMALEITGTTEVGQTLTVHAFDGADVDLNKTNVTFSIAANGSGIAGLYPEQDALNALNAAVTDSGNDLTFVLPKQVQGYAITASLDSTPITRTALR